MSVYKDTERNEKVVVTLKEDGDTQTWTVKSAETGEKIEEISRLQYNRRQGTRYI